MMRYVIKMDNTHKALDFFEHLWPYIAGGFAALVGGVKLWWSDRKEKENRITHVERILERLDEQVVFKDDLAACREEVRKVDEENLEKLYQELKELNKTNAQQHQDILRQMAILHSRDL